VASCLSFEAFDSLLRPSRCFGMTRKCVGACGEMSLKARQVSSSKMTSAGICLATILSKRVGSPASAAFSALVCFLFFLKGKRRGRG